MRHTISQAEQAALLACVTIETVISRADLEQVFGLFPTQVVGHGGNVSNLQVSEFVTVPETNFAITVLTSALGGGIGKKIVDWCMSNIAELPRPLASISSTRLPQRSCACR